MKDVEKRIKQIDIENFIWIIYFILIVLCLYSNTFEKRYFKNNDLQAKEKYRQLTIIIFVIAIIIYIYFFVDNYQDYQNTSSTSNGKKLQELNLLGSALILISGFIFLYIAFMDNDLDVELAFN